MVLRTPEQARPPEAPKPLTGSIAVLPFENFSSDPENRYFSDGLCEELIHALAAVPELRVVARTSSFCFRGENLDIKDIGRRLNVQTVIEGSVRRAGNNVRITAQVIDAITGFHLFSRTYQRDLGDVMALQEEVANAVVSELLPNVRVPVHRRPARPAAANEHYLRGRHALGSQIGQAASLAVASFEKALEIDPQYSEAWAGVADAMFLLAWYGAVPIEVALPRAKQAAARAMEIDPRIAEASAALATIECAFEWNWAEGRELFERSLASGPSRAETHHWYATTCLLPLGLKEEAKAHLRRSIELDPLDPLHVSLALVGMVMAGDAETGLRHYERTGSMGFALMEGMRGYALESLGRLEEAAESFETASRLAAGHPVPRAGYAHVLGELGETARAEQVVRELRSESDNPIVMAIALSGLRQRAETLHYLNLALDRRVPDALGIATDHRYDWLRDDPEFHLLLGRMKLPNATLSRSSASGLS